MSPEIFSLVILAATLHAAWNLVAKKAAGAAGDFVFVYRVVSAVVYAPWVVYVLYADGMPWNAMVVAFIIMASLLHLGYSLCLQKGYQAADLSVVYPIARGMGPTLSSIGAVLLLGEHPSAMSVTGMACIILGILLITSDGQLHHFTAPAARRGIGWGIFIGLFIAGYTLVDAYSVKTLLVAPIILYWLIDLGGALMLAPRQMGRRDKMMRAMAGKWRYAMIVGILSPLAYLLVLFAYQLGGDISLIAPLREVSIMIGAIAGFFLLGEKVSPARIAGCMIVITGVVLLSA